jgi:DNA-binding response OmpR family regulator
MAQRILLIEDDRATGAQLQSHLGRAGFPPEHASIAGRFRLRVLDGGPGILADRLVDFTAPRVRGEETRRRRSDGQVTRLSIVTPVCAVPGFSRPFETPPEAGLAANVEVPTASPP